MVGVGDLGAVIKVVLYIVSVPIAVAGITDAIVIEIQLVGVGHLGTVVLAVIEAVPVGVWDLRDLEQIRGADTRVVDVPRSAHQRPLTVQSDRCAKKIMTLAFRRDELDLLGPVSFRVATEQIGIPYIRLAASLGGVSKPGTH